MTVQPIIEFVVRGLPAPQGSKTAFRNKHTGRIQQVESSKAVKPWRADVREAALKAIADLNASKGRSPGQWVVEDGPIVVSMTFSFKRPKSHYRTGANAHLLKDSAPIWPQGRPDLSKLLRSTEDALTDIVWSDDARIVGYLHAAKQYVGEDRFDVLDHPGAKIRVYRAAPLGDYAIVMA